jgi:hypothetical protein
MSETLAPARRAPETDTWTPEWAASNGAVFLDEQRPGWAWEVDPETVVLADGCKCVLGQLYGEYETGCRALDLVSYPALGGERVLTLGFFGQQKEPWSPLTAAWKREILARREATP